MRMQPFVNDNDQHLPVIINERERPASNSLLEWWFYFTAPPEASANASLTRRELTRRGRISSVILLGVLLFLLAALPVGGTSHSLLYIFLPSLVISCVVFYLNRKGRLTLAGIILITGFEAGYLSGLLITPGGLGVNDLPRFDLLIEIVLLAASFLPPRVVFLVAAGNSLFTWLALAFMPHTRELEVLLKTSAYAVIETPIALQLLVAFVAFVWVSSANRAIERADRAEEVAELQRSIAEQGMMIAEQKRQLEASIQRIIDTHIRVANGDFSARVPLKQENVLWEIAGSLNNLLSRFQRLNQSEKELQQTQEKVKELVEHLRIAKSTQRPMYPHRSGTPVDPIIIELHGNYLIIPAERHTFNKHS